eukprot:COSAG06_NODE_26366_length_616_cov_1.284333_1_plen_153_part_00
MPSQAKDEALFRGKLPRRLSLEWVAGQTYITTQWRDRMSVRHVSLGSGANEWSTSDSLIAPCRDRPLQCSREGNQLIVLSGARNTITNGRTELFVDIFPSYGSVSLVACVGCSQTLPTFTQKLIRRLEVRNAIFAPFLYKMHHFAKTGSGQT